MALSSAASSAVAALRLSGKPKAIASPTTSPKPASTKKMERQPTCCISTAPRLGASSGATPSTRNNRLNKRALSTLSNLSLTTARATTTPAQAPSACAKRPTISASSEGAMAQASDASVYITAPINSGGRRPIRSDKGPYTSWPIAMPMKKADIVPCTAPACTPKSAAMVGNAGRYRSMETAPNAVSAPSRSTSPSVGLAEGDG